MASDPEIKTGMLSAVSGVQEVLRALYFYGADYIMLKMGRREKLVHKEQMISLMELGRERTTIGEMSVMTLPEPMSARTRAEDVPPETALLMFFRKGEGPAGSLSKTSFGEYREQKVKETEAVYPEWWGAPLPLLYMDDERVALNDAAAAKIPCDAKGLAAQADKMKRDGIITVKDKKRELTFSLRPVEENIYLAEDVSGDFETAEELVWWAAVGKAFVRRLEENGAVIRRLSPLEEPPASAAEVLPCSWENEPLGSVAIGMPGDAAPDASEAREEKDVETVSPGSEGAPVPGEFLKQEPEKIEESAPALPPEEPETVPVPGKPSGEKRPRKTQTRTAKSGKQRRNSVWKPKDDLDIDLNAISERPERKNEHETKGPEAPSVPSVWYESFGPFGKPAAKRNKTDTQTPEEKDSDVEKTEAAPELDRTDAGEEAGGAAETDESAEKAAPKVIDKNAARRAYGGLQRRKARNGGGENA